MFLSPAPPATLPRSAPRFLSFPPTSQLVILCTLREAALADGCLGQVPAGEWLRLLRLADPVIQPPTDGADTYRVGDGGNLLSLLLRHYLDVF